MVYMGDIRMNMVYIWMNMIYMWMSMVYVWMNMINIWMSKVYMGDIMDVHGLHMDEHNVHMDEHDLHGWHMDVHVAYLIRVCQPERASRKSRYKRIVVRLKWFTAWTSSSEESGYFVDINFIILNSSSTAWKVKGQ